MTARTSSRPRAVALGLAAVLGLPAEAVAEQRKLVHVLARGVRSSASFVDGRLVEVRTLDPTTGEEVPPPPDLLEDPSREVWVIAEGRKTRIRYAGGAEVDRRTWDRGSGRELDADLHLTVPAALTPERLLREEMPRAPGPGAGEASAAAGGEGFVGAAVPATDLFGETLGGLLPEPEEEPSPLEFTGYVDVVLASGEDGPSPHVAENGLGGNRSLEAREGVLSLDAGLGDRTRFFGQIRAVRFSSFDMRIAMLQVGDPAEDHWTIGRQAHPFGTFPARNLADRNPLFGFPLPYGYRTSLSAAAAPAGLAGIQAAKGSGGGVGLAGPGLYQGYLLYHPKVSEKLRASLGLANGALGNNENITLNDAFGAVGSLRYSPSPAWTLGLSGSVAPYLRQTATGLAPGEAPEDFDQSVLGLDLRYDRGRLRVDVEGLWSEWEVSAAAGVSELEAFGWYAEVVLGLRPKLYLATRYSALEFDEVPTGGGGSASWDADADRLEVGLGYRPSENVLAKLVGQFNGTDGAVDPDDDLVALEMVGSF